MAQLEELTRSATVKGILPTYDVIYRFSAKNLLCQPSILEKFLMLLLPADDSSM